MGICYGRFNKVPKKPVHIQANLAKKHPKKIPSCLHLAISESALSVEQEFHKVLQTKLKEPMSLLEMDKAIQEAFTSLARSYASALSSTEADLYTEFLEELEAVKYRCRAKVVYYRYINNRNSYEFYLELKESLISKLFSGELSCSALVSKYQSISKGTFDLQGLQEIHEISREFSKGKEAVESLMKMQHLKDMAHLNSQYQEAMVWVQENEILVQKSPLYTQTCSRSFYLPSTKLITSSTNDIRDNSFNA